MQRVNKKGRFNKRKPGTCQSDFRIKKVPGTLKNGLPRCAIGD